MDENRKTIEFEPATQEDNEKLGQMWRDPDIPTKPTPGYESRRIWISLRF